MLLGQKVDIRAWTGIEVKKKLNKRWDTEFSLETRFDENISNFQQTFGQFGLEYQPQKNLSFIFGYRHAQKLKKEWEAANRYSIGVLYEKKINKKFDAEFKTRLQLDSEGKATETGFEEKYWRNALEINQELSKRWDLSYKNEFWYDIVKNKKFDRYRFSLGLEYEISKRQSIQLSFINQYELNPKKKKNRDIDFIPAINYSIKL